MRIKLVGHDYRYASEQAALMFFPEEKHIFTDDEPDTIIGLSQTARYATASVGINKDNRKIKKTSRVKIENLTGYEADRAKKEALKRAFYLAFREITGISPPWGSLTGIRPAKVAERLILAGHPADTARKILVRRYGVQPLRAELCVKSALWGIYAGENSNPGDISLYIGIPFCPTRCAYCSFVSSAVEKAKKLIPPYLDCLIKELYAAGQAYKAYNIKSVYIGGGTPTVLDTELLKKLLYTVYDAFTVKNGTEFTVEAGRPDTITREKLSLLKEYNVNRLSINPQSLNDDVLKAIGRKHTAKDCITAYNMACELGFSRINMDIIAGLPGDNIISFNNTIEKIISLSPENITVHTLSIKRGSNLRQSGVLLPDAGETGVMLERSAALLTGGGYEPYYLYRQKFMSGGFENTGWTKDRPCLYNIYIMDELHTILSAGAGGVTKTVSPDRQKISRVFNHKYPYEYIENIDKILERYRKEL